MSATGFEMRRREALNAKLKHDEKASGASIEDASTKQPNEVKAEEEAMSTEERQLRDEYELLYGKKAGGRMKLETLREAVEAKKD